ncbi:MAG: RNA 3'-terminal phosphate cyclase [Nanoarchaeota archaeon]
MIQLDGGFGEGGGQMLRTALGLSLLTGKAFSMHSIRKGRTEPGLKNQHLAGIRLCKELSDSVVEGDELGCQNVVFYPRKIKPRTLSIDIGTAGSLTLLLQTVMPALVFGPGKVRLKLSGGTDVPFSPPVDYMSNILFPYLSRFAKIDFTVSKRGFYPAGGGAVEIIVRPKQVFGENLSFDSYSSTIKESVKKFSKTSRPKIAAIRGLSFASKELSSDEVAERQARAAKHALRALGCPVKIESFYGETRSTGTVISLWANFGESDDEQSVVLGGSALGEKRVRAEIVGANAAESLLSEIHSGACIDSHMSDQIVPFLAIAGGKFLLGKVSDHLISNCYVVEKFLGNAIKVDKENKLLFTP